MVDICKILYHIQFVLKIKVSILGLAQLKYVLFVKGPIDKSSLVLAQIPNLNQWWPTSHMHHSV